MGMWQRACFTRCWGSTQGCHPGTYVPGPYQSSSFPRCLFLVFPTLFPGLLREKLFVTCSLWTNNCGLPSETVSCSFPANRRVTEMGQTGDAREDFKVRKERGQWIHGTGHRSASSEQLICPIINLLITTAVLLEVMVMVVICSGGGDICECTFWWGKGLSGQLILTKK